MHRTKHTHKTKTDYIYTKGEQEMEMRDGDGSIMSCHFRCHVENGGGNRIELGVWRGLNVGGMMGMADIE